MESDWSQTLKRRKLRAVIIFFIFAVSDGYIMILKYTIMQRNSKDKPLHKDFKLKVGQP